MFEVMLGGSNKPKIESMFVGEVSASEFITGIQLASQIESLSSIERRDSIWDACRIH